MQFSVVTYTYMESDGIRMHLRQNCHHRFTQEETTDCIKIQPGAVDVKSSHTARFTYIVYRIMWTVQLVFKK